MTSELTTKSEAEKSKAYTPTRCGRKLLEVLLNPEHRFKSKGEICALAKISPRRYYDLHHDKDFMCHYTRESQKLVRMAQGPMVNALVKSAIRGNPQTLKIGLTMADLYKEKTGLVINPDADGQPRPIRFQTDLEIAVKLARILFGNKQVVEYVMAKMKGTNGPEPDPAAERGLSDGAGDDTIVPQPGR